MTVSRSKTFVLVVAFGLVSFVGMPKHVLAHPGDDNTQQDDANKKDENLDLNDDRQEGPQDELNDDKGVDKPESLSMSLSSGQEKQAEALEMNGANNDGDFNEDRVQDQQQDLQEDAAATPTGR
jgi:hypothetical protein